MRRLKSFYLLAILPLLAVPAVADENNYNPNAGGEGSGVGEEYANCQSAFFQSCESSSAGPAPLIGGGMAALLVSGALVAIRRKAKKDTDKDGSP